MIELLSMVEAMYQQFLSNDLPIAPFYVQPIVLDSPIFTSDRYIWAISLDLFKVGRKDLAPIFVQF